MGKVVHLERIFAWKRHFYVKLPGKLGTVIVERLLYHVRKSWDKAARSGKLSGYESIFGYEDLLVL
jgi:hypothetical protein